MSIPGESSGVRISPKPARRGRCSTFPKKSAIPLLTPGRRLNHDLRQSRSLENATRAGAGLKPGPAKVAQGQPGCKKMACQPPRRDRPGKGPLNLTSAEGGGRSVSSEMRDQTPRAPASDDLSGLRERVNIESQLIICQGRVNASRNKAIGLSL